MSRAWPSVGSIDLGWIGVATLAAAAAAEGLSIEAYTTTVLVYRDERRVLEFSYDVVDLPRPILSVVLGWHHPGRAVMRVPLWRLYPEESAFGDGRTLTFDSETTLRDRLELVRDRWWQTHVLAGFADQERLRSAWLTMRDEAQERYDADVRHQRLARARAAAERGDHRSALEFYALLGEDGLAATDRKRIVLARRALGR